MSDKPGKARYYLPVYQVYLWFMNNLCARGVPSSIVPGGHENVESFLKGKFKNVERNVERKKAQVATIDNLTNHRRIIK